MSTQQVSITFEGVFEMFRESERLRQESDREIKRMFQETDRQMKATNKRISKLGSRIGEIVENMVKGRIVEKFRALDYDINECSRNRSFKYKHFGISGEIDLILHDGEVEILIEVKTTLETKDVQNHIERLENYRRCVDAKGGAKRRFIGAVAGAVVVDDAEKVAHENGMYVIVQSGKAVEIVEPPEGFKAKEW